MPPGQTRAVITGSTVFPDDTLPLLRQTGYDIYVRAGLVEYLLEHPERAVAFFEKAKPLRPSGALSRRMATSPREWSG